MLAMASARFSHLVSIVKNHPYFSSFFILIVLFFYSSFLRFLAFFSPLIFSTVLCALAVFSFLPHSGGLAPFLEPPSPRLAVPPTSPDHIHFDHGSSPVEVTWLEWLHNENCQPLLRQHRQESVSSLEDENLHVPSETVHDEEEDFSFVLDQEVREDEDYVERFLEQIREKHFRQCTEITTEKDATYAEEEIAAAADDTCGEDGGSNPHQQDRSKSDVPPVNSHITAGKLCVEVSEKCGGVANHVCIDDNGPSADGQTNSRCSGDSDENRVNLEQGQRGSLQSDDDKNSKYLASKEHAEHASVVSQGEDDRRNVAVHEGDGGHGALDRFPKAEASVTLHSECDGTSHGEGQPVDAAPNDEDVENRTLATPFGGLNNDGAEKLLSIIKARGEQQSDGDFSLFAHDFIDKGFSPVSRDT